MDCLLITISEKGFVAAGRTVRAIRNGQLGRDPFLPIIIAMDATGPDNVRILIDSGVDGVLLRPLSSGKICDQLRLLTRHRKPFVVTSDYIGPNRRQTSRPGSADIPLLNAPNALHDRIVENATSKTRAARRNEAWNEMMRQRLMRYAENMRFLADRSFPSVLQGDLNTEALKDMRRLAVIAEDAWKRLNADGDAEPLARQIGDVAQRMRSFIQAPTEISRDFLTHLQTDLGRSEHSLTAFLSGAVSEPPSQ
ncbi:MAG: hypothetical protein JXQ84_07185 [Rhodospirillaceae bacterium]|nr:hypothetical protein [Rhodospirillaceae bacterium]